LGEKAFGRLRFGPLDMDFPRGRIRWEKSVLATVKTASKIVEVKDGLYFLIDGGSGCIEYEGTDAATVIQRAINSLPDGGIIFIKKGVYRINTCLEITVSPLTIDCEPGVVFESYTGGDYATTVHFKAHNGTLAIRNLVIDNRDVVGNGIGIGSTAEGIFPKLVILENLEVKGFANRGVHAEMYADASCPDDEQHDLIIRYCVFKSRPVGALNEAIYSGNARSIVVENTYCEGNKIGYIVTRSLFLNKFTYNSSDYGFGVHAKRIFIRDVVGFGTGTGHIILRPYCSVHVVTLYDNLDVCFIENLDTSGTADGRIYVQPINATYICKHVELRNIYLRLTPVYARPFEEVVSRVEKLVLDNVKFAEYSLAKSILLVENVNIDYALIDGQLPGIDPAAKVAFITNNLGDLTLNADILSVSPYPVPYALGSNDEGAGYGVSGKIRIEPIYYEGFFELVSGTSVLKPFKNSGTATISAGYTSVTVEHGLASEPSKVLVTPIGDPGARFWVANVTATSFNILVAAAPGAAIKFYWQAEVE